MSRKYDFLVVGAGAAGLRAAIELHRHGSVLCLTKRQLTESNTQYAQGGIAVALGADDSPALHLTDTLTAGAGLVDEPAARLLVQEGPARVLELLDWGIRFDRDQHGQLAFTREGAHSRHRVLHADGDSTGREIARTLLARARTLPNIHFEECDFVLDLLVADGRVTGVRVLHEDGHIENLQARATLLATGGAGMVFANTTNPEVATADGPAMALRAGAELRDMEFVQFHPTALFLPNTPRFLLSEALRGEGALLRDERGQRFMPDVHPLAELAPRDVVARAIHRQIQRQLQNAAPTNTSEEAAPCVYLDITHMDADELRHRFPRICQTCLEYGIDITQQPIPTRPAAHYAMGGIRSDLDGHTTLAGLYAAGECASTGVHGANRLASNSLLEGLVFGYRAARAMKTEPALPSAEPAMPTSDSSALSDAAAHTLREEARQLMESQVGIERNQTGLTTATQRLREILSQLATPTTRETAEARNLVQAGLAIASAALARQESRGGHFRQDFPQTDDVRFHQHSILSTRGVHFEP